MSDEKFTVTEGDLNNAFKKLVPITGRKVAENVERIYRLETRNFQSGQFLRTYSAGMEASKNSFPWGWTSLKKLWTEKPSLKPVGTVKMHDADKKDGIDSFLKFPDLFSGLFALAMVLQARGNNAGAWYSTDPDQQNSYAAKVKSITPSIVNNL